MGLNDRVFAEIHETISMKCRTPDMQEHVYTESRYLGPCRQPASQPASVSVSVVILCHKFPTADLKINSSSNSFIRLGLIYLLSCKQPFKNTQFPLKVSLISNINKLFVGRLFIFLYIFSFCVCVHMCATCPCWYP